tara:strand:+ start:357 stop:638 length:282 start_codon:yes stop_codon:yes gene_type:complete
MPHIEPKPQRGIVAAACQLEGLTFSVPAPARHHDVLWAMDAMGIQVGFATQGFLDHRGVFCGRKTAMIIAQQWGQISKEEFDPDGDLYSEHLW